jgi:hypothetical protein
MDSRDPIRPVFKNSSAFALFISIRSSICADSITKVDPHTREQKMSNEAILRDEDVR